MASIESKCGLICEPAAVVPPSRRMPAPPGERYVVIAAGVGSEALRRVLRRDAALQCGAAQHDAALVEPEVVQRLAGGDADLRLHQVDVGHLFGDGVLDLDAGVHLDEDMLAGALARRVDEELDGAGVDVADGLREGDGVAVQRLAQLVGDVRRRARSR